LIALCRVVFGPDNPIPPPSIFDLRPLLCHFSKRLIPTSLALKKNDCNKRNKGREPKQDWARLT
jgi:hypothetical protein